MTIVCAQRVGNSVWIGSDSLACSGNFKYPVAEKKWHCYATVGGAHRWWIGFTGYDRLRYLVERAALPYPVTIGDWADFLHKLAIADGWHDREKENGPKLLGDNLIIVSPDLRVYEVGSAFTPSDYGEEFCALGSGESYAYGAAFAAAATDEHPGTIIYQAVEVACKYSSTCGGPIFVEELK